MRKSLKSVRFTVCLLAFIVAFLAVCLTGCDDGNKGVNVGEEEKLDNPLVTPSDFTVDAEGNFKFGAVENANYYYLTIYRAEDATPDSDYLKLQKINSVSGQTSYGGNIETDLGFTDIGFYSVQLVAYPVTGSTYDHSYRAFATYGKSGTLARPEVEEYKEETVESPWGGAQTKVSGGIAYDNNYGNNAPLVIALKNKDAINGGKLKLEVFTDEAMTVSLITEEIYISCTSDEVVSKTLIAKDETTTHYVRLTTIGDGTYATPSLTESTVWSGKFYTLAKITY